MKKIVYVTVCIDTEGPLYENENSLLSRIEETFNIHLKRTPEILLELRNGLHVPKEHILALQSIVSPYLSTTHKTWEEIDCMLHTIGAQEFRHAFPDVDGSGMAYTWFCLDHDGYEENPRRRDTTPHAVFDHYADYVGQNSNSNDSVQFHYHPFPYNKKAHSCATYYFNSNHLVSLLGKKIIERRWFPSVFRPGFHTIRPDSHWFLEQWIPFDYSNQAMNWVSDQPDLPDGRFGDWRNAPQSWRPYHPSHDDHQQPGSCRRWIFRCLNAMSRVRTIRQEDVNFAFQEAEEHGSAVLAITDHDFRCLDISLQNFTKMLQRAAANFPDVAFKYADALTGARLYTKCPCPDPQFVPSFSASSDSQGVLSFISDIPLFGPQPYFVIVTKNGEIRYDNLDRGAQDLQWTYTLDWQTTQPVDIKCIGVAAPYASGKIVIATYNINTLQWDIVLLN